MKKTLCLLLCLTMLLGMASVLALGGQSVAKLDDVQTIIPSVDSNQTPVTYSVAGTDYPLPNLEVAGSANVGDGVTETVYEGARVLDRDFFVGYCADLENAGYTAIAAEAYAISSARTYVNADKGIMLHVFHAAGDNTLRLVKADAADAPDAAILSQQSYTATAATALTVRKVEKNADSYIFTLADGSFVVLDSGAGDIANQPNADQLWETLVELNGGATAEKPVYVRAWLIARERKSRYSCFEDFIKTYGANVGFKMDYLLFNGADASELAACVNAEQGALSAANLEVLQGICDFDVVKVHTGQIFYFANLKVEVLYTHEDAAPVAMASFNDTTTVFRTTLTDGSASTSAVWLAGATKLVGEAILSNWGNALKSDMVQMAHQGVAAVENAVFETIRPNTVLFAGGEKTYNAVMKNTSYNNIFYKTDRYAINGLFSVKKVIFNDTETVSYLPSAAAWQDLDGNAVVFGEHGGEYDAFIAQELAAEIELSNARFIYSASATTALKDQTKLVMAKIKAIAPNTLLNLTDAAAVNANERFLVGPTTRPESAQALELLDGEGWVIAVINGKVVINGTNETFIMMALTYFAENYVTTSRIAPKNISVDMVHVENAKLQNFYVAANNSFKIIYNDYVDDQIGVNDEWLENEWARTPDQIGGTYVDYVYEVAYNLRKYLAAASGLDVSNYVLCPNGEVDLIGSYVMVGAVNREDYMAELRKLSANEYGVAIRGNKVMILAWNEITLDAAYAEFKALLEANLVDGSYVLPQNGSIVKRMDEALWPTDFPMPDGDGIKLTATQNVGGWTSNNAMSYREIRETVFGVSPVTVTDPYSSDSSFKYVFTGDGVTREAFLDYAQKLKANGFVALAEENYDAVSGFSSQSFLNEATGIYLHVYHTPYNYSSGLAVDDGINALHVYAAYKAGAKTGTTGVTVPDASILTPQPYQNLTASKIVTVGLKAEGLSNVIVLADGSFVVIDGGLAGNDHAADLWTLLKTLHQEAKGTAPSATDPVYVRAWILTHEHGDHYGAFIDFMNLLKADSTMRSQFKMDYMLHNDISVSETYSSNNSSHAVLTATSFANWGKVGGAYVNGGFKYIQPQTGQKFYFANLELEVLFTYADCYPQKVSWGNNASTIYRTTITVTDANGTDETSCIWFGDAEALPSRRVAGLWGPTLKSDMVQLAHHGSMGIEYSTYELISPTVVFFPGNKDRYDSTMDPNGDYNLTNKNNGIVGQGNDTTKVYPYGYSSWNFTTNRRVLTELASVDLVIFNQDSTASGGSTEGQHLAVVLRGDGVDKNVYVAGTTTTVTQKAIPAAGSWTKYDFDQVMVRSALDSDIWR